MPGPATLRANSVRFIGATASAVGIQAPTAGVTFLPAIMAGIVGEAGPLAFLLALIAMLLVSYAFIVFAADFASAGSVFAFNGRALGAGYGFISAWLLLGVYIAYSASIYASNANFLEALVGSRAVIAWPVFAFLFWALALVLAYWRISVSTLLIFALEGAAIVLVAVVVVAVLAKGGYADYGISAKPFTLGNVPLATIGLGVIFAFTGFSGFEVAATLGEETRRPRRVIPASMLGALLVSGGIYVVVSWVETIAYPSATALAGQPVPLVDVAGRYLSPSMGTLINIAALISGIGAQLATVNGANRLLFALGRDGFGPKWLASVDRRQGSPVGALAVVGVVSIVATIPFMLNGTSPINAFFYLATYGADLIIVAYLLTSIAALVWSIRRGQRRPGRIVGLVAAIAVMGYIIKGTVLPVPESPFDLCMYAAGITIVVGLACLLLPRLRGNLARSPLLTAAAAN
ncbi:MAG TPA: APC family permease [Candidatus Dormibacteraeota bacterium]